MEIIDWQILNYGINNELFNGFILYGASGTGERMIMLLRELNISDKILAVVDSNEKKWGHSWMGYTISNPNVINSIQSSATIVIASAYLEEILNFLQNEINSPHKVCSSFSLRHAFHYELMNNKSAYFTTDITLKYKKKYELWKENLKFKNSLLQQKEYFEMVKCIAENPVSVLLCGIPKTGNKSLVTSFAEKNWKNIAFTRHALYFDRYTLDNIKEILSSFNDHKIKIISGIREPVERIISQDWQHMYIPFLYNETFIPDILDSKNGHFITELVEHEKESGMKYDCTSCFYLDVADWFDDHIKKVFGIDIFDYSFDKKKGYSIIEKDNISIFIYRLDKLDKLEEEIREFTGISSFILKRENVASEKKYIFAYKEYLRNIRIKESLFSVLANSKGMTHFYTEEECEKYRNKWQDKLI